ncbi:MAG: hypothetical protein ABL869_13815 [Candidatus Nitrotoga sp.]
MKYIVGHSIIIALITVLIPTAAAEGPSYADTVAWIQARTPNSFIETSRCNFRAAARYQAYRTFNAGSLSSSIGRHDSGEDLNITSNCAKGDECVALNFQSGKGRETLLFSTLYLEYKPGYDLAKAFSHLTVLCGAKQDKDDLF